MSVPTGRKRRLHFVVLGERFTIDVHERVEMLDLVTRKRFDPKRWHMGAGAVRTPLGCTPQYFEVRDDTRERIRSYQGVVKAEPR